jgi:hypothetical protein
VFLFDDIGVTAVKRYIDAHNIRRGLPAEPYPWISQIAAGLPAVHEPHPGDAVGEPGAGGAKTAGKPAAM